MFNWLFRNKEEVPDPIWKEEPVINHVIPREYSDKGISKSASKINPYRATLTVNTKNKKGESVYHNVHIGVYKTKEEAQKARWEFIENLK